MPDTGRVSAAVAWVCGLCEHGFVGNARDLSRQKVAGGRAVSTITSMGERLASHQGDIAHLKS